MAPGWTATNSWNASYAAKSDPVSVDRPRKDSGNDHGSTGLNVNVELSSHGDACRVLRRPANAEVAVAETALFVYGATEALARQR